MSHYSVAVFSKRGGKSVDELLAPYSENISVPHYISKNEIVETVRKEIDDYKNSTYAEYLKDPIEYLKRYPGMDPEFISREFPKRLLWTDEECYKYGIRYEEEENILDDGSVFSDYNPNAKWDWYCIGGRFSNRIPLKKGGHTDSAPMSSVNIDWRDDEQYRKSVRFWQLFVDGDEPVNQQDVDLTKFVYYNKHYYTDRFDNAEEYADWVCGFSFYAALLPNGEWLEPGRMGWFGMSDATADDDRAWRKRVKDVLKNALENDWEITIVDCHI